MKVVATWIGGTSARLGSSMAPRAWAASVRADQVVLRSLVIGYF